MIVDKIIADRSIEITLDHRECIDKVIKYKVKSIFRMLGIYSDFFYSVKITFIIVKFYVKIVFK